ncbi:baseplate J/gp47 family protein, partial [bacterium]|nr:baseplate J/gp47 family protein [bacterium]
MYVGRPRDTIRDEILALWSVQYAAIGLRLLVAPGSDAYLLASVLAVQLEGLESQLEQVGRDILPDQASPEAVARHGYVDGVARRPGTVARHSVTVTNAADGTKAIPVGSTMAYSDGTRYSVADTSVVISGGSGVITAVAIEPGSAGTRAVGNVLTFTAAITGLDPTGTVAS